MRDKPATRGYDEMKPKDSLEESRPERRGDRFYDEARNYHMRDRGGDYGSRRLPGPKEEYSHYRPTTRRHHSPPPFRDNPPRGSENYSRTHDSLRESHHLNTTHRDSTTQKRDSLTRTRDFPIRSANELRDHRDYIRDSRDSARDLPTRDRDLPTRDRDLPIRDRDLPLRDRDLPLRDRDPMPLREREPPIKDRDLLPKESLRDRDIPSSRDRDVPSSRDRDIPVSRELMPPFKDPRDLRLTPRDLRPRDFRPRSRDPERFRSVPEPGRFDGRRTKRPLEGPSNADAGEPRKRRLTESPGAKAARRIGSRRRAIQRKVCPFLLRLYVSIKGVSNEEEMQVYARQYATLRDLVVLIKDVLPEARDPAIRLHMKRRSYKTTQLSEIGTLNSTFQSSLDKRTLSSCGFEIGDIIYVEIDSTSRSGGNRGETVAQGEIEELKVDEEDNDVGAHDRVEGALGVEVGGQATAVPVA